MKRRPFPVLKVRGETRTDTDLMILSIDDVRGATRYYIISLQTVVNMRLATCAGVPVVGCGDPPP